MQIESENKKWANLPAWKEIHMWKRKYIIWSNENLDTEDWKESFKEFIEMNNLDIDPNDEEEAS